MAALSPLLIASSPLVYAGKNPPAAAPASPLRLHYRSNTIYLSSSPQLPSPSALVRSKDASRTSVGPDENDFLRRKSATRERDDSDARRKTTGKLVKPVKKPKKTVEAAEHSVARQAAVLSDGAAESSIYFGVACEKSRPGDVGGAGSVVTAVPSNHPLIVLPAQQNPVRNETAREPRIGLSRSVLEVINRDAATVTGASNRTVSTGKDRKKNVRDGRASGAKRPAKRMKKSESIVLNSDEPDDVDAKLGHGVTSVERQEGVAGASVTISRTDPPASRQQGVKSSNGDRDLQLEHSTYFTANASPLPPPEEVNKEIAVHRIDDRPVDEALEGLNLIAVVHPEPATKRRLSWTPAKDTRGPTLLAPRPPTADSHSSDADHPPKGQLSDILGTFGYVSKEVRSAPTNQVGEPLTKRRKLELTNPVAIGLPKRQSPEDTMPAIARPAKAKQPKKKAQTITALATAAFQPAKEVNEEVTVISQFFANAAPATEAREAAPKPKRPRKTRVSTKANPEPGPASTKLRRRKPRPKLSEEDLLPRLYSPARAAAQLHHQDLLFGTSSQLAVDEHASYIRDMQAAMQESENMPRGPTAMEASSSQLQPISPGTVVSPHKWKSCVRVPTAPHGTCLSLAQAEKGMWCEGSRDFKGGIFRSFGFKRRKVVDGEARERRPAAVEAAVGQESAAGNDGTGELCKALPNEPAFSADAGSNVFRSVAQRVLRDKDTTGRVYEPLNECAQREIGDEIARSRHTQIPNQSTTSEAPVVNCSTNRPTNGFPLARASVSDDLDRVPPNFTSLKADGGGHDSTEQSPPGLVEDDDSWMLLQSDEPEPPQQAKRHPPLSSTLQHARSLSPPPPPPQQGYVLSPPQPFQKAHASTPPPPFQQLRLTAPPPPSFMTIESIPHVPPVSTDRNAFAPVMRPPLRPLDGNVHLLADTSVEKSARFVQARTFSSAAGTSKSSTGRPRGRPRKNAAVQDSAQTSPKRRGRPPKEPVPGSDPALDVAKPKRRKVSLPRAQPAISTEWLDIDEIDDSDVPITPSPPRRRARSTQPVIKPLQLSPTGVPPANAPAPALAMATVKPADPNWPSVRSVLFSRITETVKSATPSSDAAKPSWWEKILLYDPIVLEDLTAWLNGQGLCVQVTKAKERSKKGGRKKKQTEPDEADELGWEVRNQPLEHWMVQKWCEEKSVCCLWKEGLRGGVKTKY